MIESCSRRRMIASIIVMLICTSLVLLFEEYIEDTKFETTKILRKFSEITGKKENDSNSNPTIPQSNITISENAEKCEPTENTVLVKSCVLCPTRNANSVYCRTTGFYNSFECATSRRVFRTACLLRDARTPSAARNFALFAGASGTSTFVFGTFVRWRRALIESRATYSRLPQILDT